jgi:carbon-monoxide dehydrogenase large subunit
MNVRTNPVALDTMKFAIGQPVPRNEDPVLVRGEGRYTDDVSLPGQLHAAFVRSPYAHGVLRGIDGEAAKAMPGVVAVITGADLQAAGMGTLKCTLGANFNNRDGSPMVLPPRPFFALDKVRFVGDPVAVVIAESADAARDAAEAVVLDVEPLPAVTTPQAALAPGAPVLYDEAPGNLALDYRFGDAEAVEAAFQKAFHVARLAIVNSRVVVNPMEPRAAVATFDEASGRYTLHAPSQGVFGMRGTLAGVLGVEPKQVRLLTGHVGGSFGMKSSVFPEYVALLHAARTLGKPVKWVDFRAESFVSDHHGRGSEVTAELALDKDGRFLALRVDGYGDMGAYLTPVGPMMTTLNVAKNGIGMYRTPHVEVTTRCVFTNTVPIGAYRGAGRPEGNYYMERLIETAAREMGIDATELRRRNMVAPAELPYTTPAGTVYDSGDFAALMDRALAAADWAGFAERRKASEAAGKLRGRGLGCYLEVTAPPSNEMGGIRFEEDGTVTIVSGTLDYGQGHWTPFAQVLVSKLGVPFEAIRLVQGDSDRLIAGGGTGGSKSIMASGAAIAEAGDKVIEKGRVAAAAILEAGVADIEFGEGRFTIAGTDRSIGIMDLARRLREAKQSGAALPADVPETLDVDHVHKQAPSAYPNGCHVAEVEIDPDTGHVEVVRYTMVNDFGTIVNPLLVEGQLHGGVMQGIGQALMEMTLYDGEGQLVTGSFMDYAMPRAEDAPPFAFESRPAPARTNVLGAKGCGEAGCAGSLPSVMNAVVDALSTRGVTHMDMPATPLKVWTALHGGADPA